MPARYYDHAVGRGREGEGEVICTQDKHTRYSYWSPSSCLVEPMAPMRWNGRLLVSTLNFREQVDGRKGHGGRS